MNLPDDYHQKIFDDIHDAIKRIYADTFTTNFYIDGALEILGSSDDWRYYSNESIIIAIRFLEVSYISLPTYIFYNPIFRLANTSETADVRKSVDIDLEEVVYVIEAETTSSLKRLPFFIVAEDISFQVKSYQDM